MLFGGALFGIGGFRFGGPFGEFFGDNRLQPPAGMPAGGPASGMRDGMLWHGLTQETAVWLTFLGLLVIAVPAALMFVRRRFPLPVLCACMVWFVAVTMLSLPSIGPGIAVVIAGYAFAFRADHRPTLWIAIGILAALVLLSLWAGGWDTLDLRVLQIAAGFAVAAALGEGARARRDYVEAMTERAERAEQSREAEARRRVSEERLRIARDLHDTVAHEISVISLHAGAATSALPDRPAQAEQALGAIRTAARGALQEIGELLRFLRADDEPAGAGEAVPPQPGVDRIAELIARTREAGLEVNVETHGDLDAVGDAVGATAYRVVQEGLTNAHKHGALHRAALTLTVTEQALLIRLDNPVGASVGGAGTGGLGLIGIRERVSAVGGTVSAERVHDRFVLTADLPLGPADPHTEHAATREEQL